MACKQLDMSTLPHESAAIPNTEEQQQQQQQQHHHEVFLLLLPTTAIITIATATEIN
jgi:hypothetical protein